MGINGYPKDLPGVTKLLNNYITEIGNNRNFMKTYKKEQTGVAFTQTQEKDEKYKKNNNTKRESNCFHYGKQYHRAEDFPNIEK